MSNTLHAFDFLAKPPTKIPGVVVLFGGEAFLKRLAAQQLRAILVEDDETPFSTFDGSTTQWRDVADELSTVSLFGGDRRLVILEQADSFVSRERGRLEEYAAKSKHSSVLILQVDTWAANTRLYKTIDAGGLQVECRPPEKASGKRKALDQAKLLKWLVTWTKQQHTAKLDTNAAELLVEISGPELGLLDQELAKLSLFVGEGGTIDVQMVRDVVGGWRTNTIWELVDAAADGDSGEALRQLDRLLQAGEQPIGLFAQVAWSLRRFAAATRLYQEAERDHRRLPLREALIQAGFPHWNRQGLQRAEAQLKQLRRERAGEIYQWLLQTDLSLKGSHSSPTRARFALEQLLLRMGKGLAKSTGNQRSAC